METVRDRLATSGPKFSVEFMPPRDDAAEIQLWRTIRELEPLRPAFVSVTYGAGGSSRDRTIRVTGRIAAETSLLPVAHLTAVNHTVAELRHVIGSYATVGVRNILALRGDPPGDVQGDWVPTPGGLDYAEDLVRLVTVARRLLRRGGRLPGDAPEVPRPRERHPLLPGQAARRGRLRDHPDAVRRRRLPAAAGPDGGQR